MRFLWLYLASLPVLVGLSSLVSLLAGPAQLVVKFARGPSSACSQGPKVAAEIPRSPGEQTLLTELDNFPDMLYSPALLPVAVVGKENEESW